jgi:hypothetical protein
MPTTQKFDQAIKLLHTHFKTDDKFSLTDTDAGGIAKALQTIVGKIPGKKLDLVEAEWKADDETKWTVSGKPYASSAGWQLPGIKPSEIFLPESAVVLTVEDGGEDEEGKEKNPKFKLTLTAFLPIGEKPVPLSTTITEKDEQVFTLGKKSKPTRLSLAALAEKLSWSGGADELAHVGDLMKLKAIDLAEAKLTADMKTNSVTQFLLGANFTLGPVRLELTIEARNNDEGKFSRETMSVRAGVASDQGPFQLGDLLSDLAGTRVWPKELDPKLESLSISRVFVPKGLNSHDTQRIVFQSPAGSEKPEVLVTSFFYDDGKRYFIARLGWPLLQIPPLPVVGDYLEVHFDPFFAILTNKTLSVKEVVALTSLDKFEGLETMGISAEKAKDKAIARGLHAIGVLHISDTIKTSFYKTIRAADEELPFEIEEMPEARDAVEIPVQRNLGPVRLAGATLKYEQGRLGVALSGAVETKGFTFEVLGLGLSLPLKLPDPTPVSLLIEGGIISYKSSSVSISGGLVPDRSGPDGIQWFGTGLLKVGKNFSLTAVFAYSDTQQKSLFLFAYVRRQLGGPTWCYITGLAAGFGYNRSFIVPAVDHVNDFPLIDMANKLARGDEDAVPEKVDATALRKLVARLKDSIPASTTGDNFGVAGMTFTSFGYANSTLLLSITFGARLEFVLLGSSLIQVPKGSGKGANVELQLVGAVKPDDGLVSIDAVLSPNSYILAKDCRLTGGFGLRVWFSGANSGDFVVSLGGYNPGYIPPAHYPLVPRLGILWKYSDKISVTGFAYLAITPKNIQLGGGLDMVYDLDPLRAWVHLEIHLLIGWSPFTYDARLRVDFGISFRLDLLFCSTTITAEIGANLHIWGPPFAGHVDINLWFVSFGVSFGSSAQPEPPLLWTDFVSAFVTPVPKPEPVRIAAQVTPETPLLPLQIIPVNGLTERKNATVLLGGEFGNRPFDWFSDPQQFELQISTAIPVEIMRFNTDTDVLSGTQIHARPLKDSPHIGPRLLVTLTRLGNETLPRTTADQPFQVKCTSCIGAVPAALWAKPAAKDKPKPDDDKETIRAITHLSLAPIVYNPGKSARIDTDKLLFGDLETRPLRWQAVRIPQETFKWETHSPYKTITLTRVAETRAAILADLGRLGFVPKDAASKIRLDNMKPEQHCFMLETVVCVTGTANTAA